MTYSRVFYICGDGVGGATIPYGLQTFLGIRVQLPLPGPLEPHLLR